MKQRPRYTFSDAIDDAIICRIQRITNPIIYQRFALPSSNSIGVEVFKGIVRVVKKENVLFDIFRNIQNIMLSRTLISLVAWLEVCINDLQHCFSFLLQVCFIHLGFCTHVDGNLLLDI